MRPLLKPIAAVLALSLVMPAYAASHTGKAAPSKSSGSCSSKHKTVAGNPTAASASGCWLDKVAVNGNATVIAGNLSPYSGDSSSFVQVQHFGLDVDAALTSNINSHIGLTYEPGNTSDLAGAAADGNDSTSSFDLKEAYLTWSDAAKSPLYAKVGRSYSSFGTYSNAYPAVIGLNQTLVQANFTTAELGFASNFGFNSSLFLFEDSTGDWDKYGFHASYKGAVQDVKYNAKFSYVSDYSSFASSLTSTSTISTADADEAAYNFDLSAAMKNMEFGLSYFASAGDLDSSTTSTRPKVWSFGGKYKMDAMGYKSNLHACVENASDSGNVLGGSLASTVKRLTNVGVGMDLSANTTVGFDIFKSTTFATSDSDQTQYMFSASVRF